MNTKDPLVLFLLVVGGLLGLVYSVAVLLMPLLVVSIYERVKKLEDKLESLTSRL